MLARVYILDAGRLLGFKDNRSTEGWLKKHGISVFNDMGRKFVLKMDLEIAIDYPVIKNLQAEYGENWPHYYSILKSEDVEQYLSLKTKKKSKARTPKRYKPKTKSERMILQELRETFLEFNPSNNGKVTNSS